MDDLTLLTVTSEAITPAQTAAVIALCSEAFELDYAFYMNLDLYRVHVLGYLGDQLVAHALWLERRLRVGAGPWRTAAYVEGVATAAPFQRRGYGAAVMRRLQAQITAYALGALSPAVPEWYARLGWIRWQGPLQIQHGEALLPTPGEECVMVYPTPHTGPLDVTVTLTGEWRPFELW